MDNISGADGIIWLFVIVGSLIFILLMSSSTLWIKNKRGAQISYTISCIVTLLLIVNGINNLRIAWPWYESVSYINTIKSVLLFFSTVFMVLGVTLKCKQKKYSNVTLNIGNALCLMEFIYELNTINAAYSS